MSILNLEMSFAQDQQEHLEYLDAPAADKEMLRPAGVLESKGGSMQPPSSTFDSATPIISIRDRLARIVNHQLERMEKGEIEQLYEQHNAMLHQLAILSVSSSASVTLSESDPSNLSLIHI